MDWFFNIDTDPFVIHPCVGLSIHLVHGPFEPKEFGGIDGFVSYGHTENVPGASFSFDFNPSFAEDSLKDCFKRVWVWNTNNVTKYKGLFAEDVAGSHLDSSGEKCVYRITFVNISEPKGGQQFLKKFKTILPGAMLSKVAPATHNVGAMIGTPKMDLRRGYFRGRVHEW